jgi:thiamine-phosphate pyrophosphorylase
MKLRGLYAITPETGDDLVARVRAAVAGGVAALQYRRKARASLDEARSLASLCHARQIPFIVNDDLDLALASGADGVHLGRDDGDVGAARKRIKGKILGISCYASLDDARAAVAAGADYVAFGSVFSSPTKPGAARAPLSLFAQARALGVPLVAIGGITLANTPQLLAAGADAVAVISDLFDSADITARARRYQKLFLQNEITQ